jgi:hypothetical protein
MKNIKKFVIVVFTIICFSELIFSAIKQISDVPYIHQVYDTPDWFNGHWACGATSAMMVISYYKILPYWDCTVSQPYSHVSHYGRYICEKYTFNGVTYNYGSADPNGTIAYGGYGYITRNNWADTKGYMRDYFKNHKFPDSYVDWSPSYSKLRSEIDAGRPFVLLNSLTSAGHYITIIGYFDNQYTVVSNDPYGNKNTPGYPSYDGAGARYDWPGYNNGYKNLNAVHCFIYARGYTGGSAPSAPTLVSPSNGATGVSLTPTLQWNAVSGASSYRVQVDDNSDFSSVVVDASGLTGTSYSVPSGKLNYNTKYYWRVNASNSYGTSGWSSVWNFTTMVSPPSAPTNVVFKYNESGYGGVLSCSSVSGATAYEFAYRPSGGSWTYYYDQTGPNAGNIGWPAWYFVVPNAGSYDFAVRAKNSSGTSSWVYVNGVSFPEYVRPGVPSGVTAVVLSSTSIKISWTAVSGATGYTIYRSKVRSELDNLCLGILPTGTTNWSGLSYATDADRSNTNYAGSKADIWSLLRIDFSGVKKVHKLYFRLYDGDNRIYKYVRARWYDAGGNVVELDSGYRAFRTEWCYRLSSSGDVDSSGVGIGFSSNQGNTTNLYNHITEVESYGGYLAKVTGTSYTDTGLEPDTVYYYRVDAYKVVGSTELISDSSVIVSTRTLGIPGVVPNAPSNLQSVVLSSTSVKLTWQDNSSNESGFKIERKLAGGGYSVVATLGSNVVTYTDNGLQTATTYYYRVYAYNSIGNSSYSNEVVAVTYPSGQQDVTPATESYLE